MSADRSCRGSLDEVDVRLAIDGSSASPPWQPRSLVGGGQRPPNYQSKIARWRLEGLSSPGPPDGSHQGVPRRHLDGGMEALNLHAAVKERIEKSSAVAGEWSHRRERSSSCHVTASLTTLHCSSSAGRPSRRGRPSRPPWPARRSGAHPPLRPLELSPTSSRRPASLELRGRLSSLQRAGGRGLWV